MVNFFEWKHNHTKLHFLPQKLVHLPDHHTLVIADWHLGKITHFRKNGAFLPPVNNLKQIKEIQGLIEQLQIKTVILLGDVFHSELNSDWFDFIEFLEINHQIRFILTKGNHDILPKAFYQIENLEVVKSFQIDDVIFSHEKIKVAPNQVNVIGHHHPGINIKGRARQNFKLPCFYFENQTLIIPAYGEHTGLYLYQKTEENRIYPIFGDEIIEYNP